MKKPNLRGHRVEFFFEGRKMRGVVITRIRDTRWQISSQALPLKYQRRDYSRRVTLDEAEFVVLP